jgi:hypothetical protein
VGFIPDVSLFAGLTAGAREAAPFILSLSQIGQVQTLTRVQQETLANLGLENVTLSANRILQIANDAGLAVRRSDGLALIRNARQQVSTRPYISSVGLDKLPNPARFATPAYQMNDNYHYLVRVDGVDPETGERTTRYVTVASETVLTKQAALDTAGAYIETDPESYHISEYELTVENAFVNPTGVIE